MNANKFIMTFESFRSSKIRLKNQRKREKVRKLQRKRMDGEKGFGSDDPVNAGETIKRLEL